MQLACVALLGNHVRFDSHSLVLLRFIREMFGMGHKNVFFHTSESTEGLITNV